MEARQAVVAGQFAPLRHKSRRILEPERIENGEKRFAVHPDIAGIAESGQQGPEMHLIVFPARVALLHQDL